MTFPELRKRTGLSRSEFCKRLNISYRTVEKWEAKPEQCKPYIVRALYYQLYVKKMIDRDPEYEKEEEQ